MYFSVNARFSLLTLADAWRGHQNVSIAVGLKYSEGQTWPSP